MESHCRPVLIVKEDACPAVSATGSAAAYKEKAMSKTIWTSGPEQEEIDRENRRSKSRPQTEKYADAWERIFGQKKDEAKKGDAK